MPKHWERLRQQHDPAYYAAYMRSHHWRRLRKLAIARASYRCMRCGREDPNRDKKPGTRLQVHHRTYERIGHEHLEDLAVLCAACHKAEHRPKLWRLFGKLGMGKVATGASGLGFGKVETRKRLSSSRRLGQ